MFPDRKFHFGGRTDLAFMVRMKLWALVKLMAIVLVGVMGSFAHTTLASAPSDAAPLSKEDVEGLKEVLWLARAVYSESKVASDQRLVACTIRYRVESGRWGDSYENVVLSRHQFSGLHPYSWNKLYSFNMSRTYQSSGETWKTAVDIAKKTYMARSVKALCPELPKNTMHFYSPQSVVATPAWASKDKLVYSVGTRFAFYANVN